MPACGPGRPTPWWKREPAHDGLLQPVVMRNGRSGDVRPTALRVACVLWLVLAGLLLATVLIGIGLSVYDPASGSSTLSEQLVFGVVILVFALRMRAGRNWARIALVVCGALFVLAAVNLAQIASTGAG